MALKVKIFLFLSVFIIVSFFIIVDPISQPDSYNNFYDKRQFFKIKNFYNIISNIPFLIVGVVGLLLYARQQLVHDNHPYTPVYAIMFGGVILIGIGSMYFHALPNNQRLLWDRLPMAIVFMSLTAGLLCEHTRRQWQGRLLYPLLAAGVASVVYWYLTELQGRGDLRAYLLVQFLPMLLIPSVMLAFPSRFSRRGDVWWALACYVLAKCAELNDRALFLWTGVISGHTLKHLLAAVALLLLLRMLYRRKALNDSGGLSQE